VTGDCQHSESDRRVIGGPQSRILHHGRKFDLELLTLPGRDGRPVEREVIRHPGAAVILPILDTPAGQRIVMIRNRRPAIGPAPGKVLWELPAGTLEPPEPPEQCAARELVEETGYRAATLVPLGRFYTTPGMTDELMWPFVATGLVEVGQKLEADEDLTVEAIESGRAMEMMDRGDLMDGKSMLALLLAQRRGLLTSD
jgi:ADP-ribose pyrophosphatase